MTEKPLSAVFNEMVGKPFDEAVFRTAAAREGLISRVIRPETRVVKDTRSNRINAHIDPQGVVEKIRMG